MKNIRNCKIRILNAEHSKAIQEKAFSLGFKLDTPHSRTKQNLNSDCLYFGSNFITWSPFSFFEKSDKQEIFFYNGEFHHESQVEFSSGYHIPTEEQKTNADIKTHPIFDNGFQYGEVVYFSWRGSKDSGVYLAPCITSSSKSVVMIKDGNKIIEVYNDHLEKQSDYEDRKSLENLTAKVINLFAASVETVYPEKRFTPYKEVFLEFTKRLKSEDLLPF